MRSLYQQISEKCIHFNGVQNDCCKAGIKYTDLAGSDFPCFRGDALKSLRKGELPSHCDKTEFPTEEYIQNEIAEHDKAFKKVDEGLKAVAHIRKEHNGKNWSGVIECPICKGKLHVSHASLNNHVHAQCETKDCIAWME